jgi:flagellar protein FliS
MNQIAIRDFDDNAPLRPTEIVCGLFDRLLAALTTGREAISAGDIERRFQELKVAADIVEDLAGGLDPEASDEWTVRMAALYKAVLARLLTANIRNAVAPIEEAMLLAAPLRHAWHCLDAQEVLRQNGVSAALMSERPAAVAAARN